MKKKEIAVTITLTVVLFLVAGMLEGCAQDLPLEEHTEVSEHTEIQVSEKTDRTEIENSIPIFKSDMRKKGMDFSVRLFQNSIQENQNALISPLSVMIALSMTANGANGETLAELEEAFGSSVETWNSYFLEYQTKLMHIADYQFYIANSIWINNDNSFSIQPDFVKTVENYYHAGIYETKFDEKAVKDMNQWIAKTTENQITDIISEMPDSTMLYLINALMFDAEWENPYTEKSVKTGYFTKENRETQKTSFMYSIEDIYLEDENTIGVVKYYKDEKYAFVGLLPKEGISLEDYLKTLSTEKITALFEQAQTAIVSTSIPKFTQESTLDMKTVLKKMGIRTIFDIEKADLSGLGSYKDFNTYIDCVTHKTYLSVLEQGTKAGAVTAIDVTAGSAMLEQKQVNLNRPFVYLIIDWEEQLPVFMGTMVEMENETKDK